MLLLLTIIYCIRQGSNALPLDLDNLFTSRADPISLTSPSPGEQRSLLDIIWSCLATTIACAWVTAHPNVPEPNEEWWWVTWTRIKAMFWALVAPELVFAWSCRQYLDARNHSKKYKSRGWTMVHGHFFAMGGFLLYEDGKPAATLDGDDLEQMSQSGEIDFPSISAEEIMDKSKGDGLSKVFALVQTIWFIAQCISRYIQHLALAELEVTTLALAAVNAMMYFCWWDKPLNVLYPVRVDHKPLVLDQSPNDDAVIRTASTDTHVPHLVSLPSDDSTSDNERQTHSQWMYCLSTPFSSFRHCILQPLYSIWTAIAHALRESITEDGWWGTVTMLVFVHLTAGPMFELIGMDDDASGHLRVGIFASTRSREYIHFWIVVPMGICVSIFGVIHIVAWSSDFPSNAERVLWRSAAAIISCEPALPAIAFMFAVMNWSLPKFLRYEGYVWGWLENVLDVNHVIGFVIALTLFVLYVLARVLLLILSVATLQELPPSAFEKVQWSEIFPHI
ncbi:hypothetical protein DXG01_005828 [Tephrocybe rancida]|nr:hypothetical protein DXG01_005828 [Tephrocybe rancida]